MSELSREACPRTEDAGAYLLGALSPGERAEFAAHLPDCLECLREVGQLAGLPGLLARSSAEVPDPLAARPPVPPSGGADPAAPLSGPARRSGSGDPVRSALAQVRGRRTRLRALTAAAVVGVALLGVGGTAAVSGSFGHPATGVYAAGQLPVTMQPMGGAKASAALALTDRPWGTEVVMRCRYQGSTEYGPPVYVLVARAADGTTTQLARWTALPNQDIVLAGATQLNRSQLTSVEIQDTKGRVVLAAQHV